MDTIGNPAYQEEPRYEIIHGKAAAMSPATPLYPRFYDCLRPQSTFFRMVRISLTTSIPTVPAW